jgi:periplasmic protein TonB
MSVAQQTGPDQAPNGVARLRWALVATGLALVVVLVLLATVLLSMRRARVPAPTAAPRLSRIAVPVRRSASIKTPVGPTGIRSRRTHGVTRPRPSVEIVERRITPPPVIPFLRPLEPVRPHPVAPRPQRVLADRWTLKPPVPVSPALVAKPPPIIQPDASSGEVEARESPPEPIARPPARYPEDAADEGVTGSVRLKVVVSRRGRVEEAVVVRSSGDDRLDQAAEAAVRRWRYRPAQRDGRAVTAVDYAVIEFYREDREPGSPD